MKCMFKGIKYLKKFNLHFLMPYLWAIFIMTFIPCNKTHKFNLNKLVNYKKIAEGH
jgi:hypothetical protein